MMTVLYIVLYLQSTKDDININVRLIQSTSKNKLSQSMTKFISTYEKKIF